MKGEVPLRVFGSILPVPLAGTLPFMGRVGEGQSTEFEGFGSGCSS